MIQPASSQKRKLLKIGVGCQGYRQGSIISCPTRASKFQEF